MKNCVSIQLKKDKIMIRIQEEATQDEIVECLKRKLTGLKKLYQEEHTPIIVTGKVLKNKEIAKKVRPQWQFLIYCCCSSNIFSKELINCCNSLISEPIISQSFLSFDSVRFLFASIIA